MDSPGCMLDVPGSACIHLAQITQYTGVAGIYLICWSDYQSFSRSVGQFVSCVAGWTAPYVSGLKHPHVLPIVMI